MIALAAVKHEVRAPFAMKESEEQRGKSAKPQSADGEKAVERERKLQIRVRVRR